MKTISFCGTPLCENEVELHMIICNPCVEKGNRSVKVFHDELKDLQTMVDIFEKCGHSKVHRMLDYLKSRYNVGKPTITKV